MAGYPIRFRDGDVSLGKPWQRAGQTAKVIKVDSGVGIITIGTSSSQTINGQSTYTLSNQWQAVQIESTGTNWIVSAVAP